MRPPTAKTIAEAAEVLIAGAHDGTILDEQLLRSYVVPALGGWKLTQIQRRDVRDFVDDLRKQGLSASTIANIVDPLRVIFRRAIRRDEVSIDPTDNLDLPAIRGRRDRIEPPERAHEYLAALPDSERAFWAVALFCGLRRGELRGLQWINVDFEAGVIRVDRSWDPVKGPVDVKTGAGRRAVPMAFVVRRELMAHKARTGRDGPDLVFGRTATEAFFASTVRARANKAWKQAGLEPLTPHEARHCAISYFIAAGLDWKQISTWAGHGDVRQTWNRYGHLVPGGEDTARERLDAFLTPTQPTQTVAHTVAHAPIDDETPENLGVLKYRYRDSNPGFRRERAFGRAYASPIVPVLQEKPEMQGHLETPDAPLMCPYGVRERRCRRRRRGGKSSSEPALGSRGSPPFPRWTDPPRPYAILTHNSRSRKSSSGPGATRRSRLNRSARSAGPRGTLSTRDARFR